MSQGRYNPPPFEGFAGRISPKHARLIVIAGAIVIFLILAAATSFHTVDPEGRSVLKRFGKVVDIREPGLHFKLPFGIDKAYFVPTERQLTQEFGFRTVSIRDRTQYEKQPTHREESLMLTGDLKVIDVEWVVQYRVTDPDKYMHRVRDPEKTIRDVSEAVMRRIVGNQLGSDVLTEKRVYVSHQSRQELQDILDSFDMGVTVRRIELQDVTPPENVKPAFNEVNQAEQERERLINEAEKRRNQAIPRAEGEARKIIEEAEAYSAERINKALGEAERFTAILTEYSKSPDVTRRRLYLEMIDKILPNVGRIYVVEGGTPGPFPLLHLGEGGQPAVGR